MTEKQFYDWQTLGGTDDVMRFVNALESADISWCAIGDVAVNHWDAEQMVTLDVDFVVAADSIEKAEKVLTDAGFKAEEFEWSINFKGRSKVAIQLTTETMYLDYASRGVAADVHGILMRVASLEDTLAGKIRAWCDPKRRQSKRFKDLADITRLVESHPALWQTLPEELKAQINPPNARSINP
jgi:Nucleotidyl transferase AbiEii toxin, Type IV TA system